jgi:putative protease
MKQLPLNHKTELLAPAGSPEAFYGAIHAGADAVYLGGKQFGARAYAANFTEDELIHCIDYAHGEGRKVYLTLNTLLKEKEFSGLYQYLYPYVTRGLDAVIVQDMGVLSFIHRNFPHLPIHASTQMSQTGILGIRELQDLGVSRVIPARELSLEELQTIKKSTDIELEVFIHGAMCYSYSGQCLFSSMLGGRSGNRGCCAQPCRLPYQLCLNRTDRGQKDRYVSPEAYYLSLKDLYTLPLLPQLLDIGIDSLKIEGRMKKAEYSAEVTAVYRKYIDLYRTGEWKITPEDQDILTRLYMRSEQQTGYLLKRNGGDMVTLSSPAYRETDENLLQEIRRAYSFVPRKRKVTIYGSFLEGSPAVLNMVHKDLVGTASGSIVAAARTKPTSPQAVKEQLAKLGDTDWEADEIYLEMDDHSFLPVGEIKSLRRQALAQLEERLVSESPYPSNSVDNSGTLEPSDITKLSYASESTYTSKQLDSSVKSAGLVVPGLAIMCTTHQQLQALIDNPPPKDTLISGIYIEADVCMENGGILWEKHKGMLTRRNIPLYLVLPPILRRDDDPFMNRCIHLLTSETFAGCMIRSLEGYGHLKSCGKTMITDHFIPFWNKEALAFWQDKVGRVTLPLECNRHEQISLYKAAHEMGLPLEKVIFGRIPMMLTANCIAGTLGKCVKTNVPYTQSVLIDRYQKKFPVRLNCNHCMNIIYNSVPLSLHKEIAYWQDKAVLRLDFTVESREETACVLRWAYAGFSPKLPSFFADGYTTGHESRGVM